jgi:hypothetical protein
MSLLQLRLNRAGFRTTVFQYSTVHNAPRLSATELNAFCAGQEEAVLHFVAHSLGGLVVRHLFSDYPHQRPGRVVTLGTPHQPSSAAGSLSRLAPGRIVLGRSVQQGLLGGAPPWDGCHELGSIAGTLRFGLGTLVPGIPAPSDGTVAVAETRIEGMADHITAPVSHFGLLLSRRVAHYTAHFLRTGRFPRKS